VKLHCIRFGDLGHLFDGPHATPTRQSQGPYFLNIASLVDGRLDLTQSDHVSSVDFVRWTKRVTPAGGDLLFSYETRLGDAALMPGGVEACLGRRMALLRPNRQVVDPRFLLYYYLSPDFRTIIDRYTIHGATVNRIGLSTMGSWPISIPDLNEQRAIAEVLGALDDKIAVNANLLGAASGLAVALLSDHSPSVALADVVTHQKRSLAPTDFGDSWIAHFSLPAFDAGQRPQRTLPEEIKSSKFLIEQPCVLVSKLNPRFPRIWNVVELPNALAVSSTEFLVLESTHCAPSVLWAILSQSSFSAELESKVAGTSGSHQRVRPADLLATDVIDPRSLNDGTKTQLDSLGRRIAVCLEESAALASMRDALLPQLLSGKVRVNDAEQRVGDVV